MQDNAAPYSSRGESAGTLPRIIDLADRWQVRIGWSLVALQAFIAAVSIPAGAWPRVFLALGNVAWLLTLTVRQPSRLIWHWQDGAGFLALPLFATSLVCLLLPAAQSDVRVAAACFLVLALSVAAYGLLVLNGIKSIRERVRSTLYREAMAAVPRVPLAPDISGSVLQSDTFEERWQTAEQATEKLRQEFLCLWLAVKGISADRKVLLIRAGVPPQEATSVTIAPLLDEDLQSLIALKDLSQGMRDEVN